ncbi:MAG: 23S rRNA (uracil(1939)-C(5))-methyltransferase RlmD [Oscillospiraceae bacterium]|nr:23S rRNA (uracil(1939)-C(5))-methyltransferase RlmD [Oscillospiraceae bacterium]
MMTHTVTVTGYNSDGEGVSRLEDGRVVFIRGAARHDVLEVSVIWERSKITRAEIVRLISASPFRIESDCPVYPKCGGCDFRHITYEEELAAKLQCVNDALRRIGGLPVEVEVKDILHTGQINGYRNKAVFHSTGNGTPFGFYQAGSRDIVPIEHCLLLKDDLNNAIRDLNPNDTRVTESITLRSGRSGVNMPLEEELDGLVFKVEGFFQVNTNAALLLFQKAREYARLTKEDTLIDLYCGVGALTLFIGRDASYALGIEHNPDAVKTARENAKCNSFSHIEFVNADAAEWVSDLTTPDCVVVDPPRKGLSQGAVRKIFELSPKRLVYISCNPATLARDLKLLKGYTIREICAVDMFPRTANIECCCLLSN